MKREVIRNAARRIEESVSRGEFLDGLTSEQTRELMIAMSREPGDKVAERAVRAAALEFADLVRLYPVEYHFHGAMLYSRLEEHLLAWHRHRSSRPGGKAVVAPRFAPRVARLAAQDWAWWEAKLRASAAQIASGGTDSWGAAGQAWEQAFGEAPSAWEQGTLRVVMDQVAWGGLGTSEAVARLTVRLGLCLF